MRDKLTPKIILEGTRLTRKTDLAFALKNREVLIEPNSPSPGVTVAFIVDNGAPIEFLRFTPPAPPSR